MPFVRRLLLASLVSEFSRRVQVDPKNMTDFLQVHPKNPDARVIKQAVEVLLNGGVIVYPTDSGYALGCHIGDKSALERIRRIRQLDSKHNFTLICPTSLHYRFTPGSTIVPIEFSRLTLPRPTHLF